MTSAERIIKIDNEQLEFDVRIKFANKSEKEGVISNMKLHYFHLDFTEDLIKIFEGKK